MIFDSSVCNSIDFRSQYDVYHHWNVERSPLTRRRRCTNSVRNTVNNLEAEHWIAITYSLVLLKGNSGKTYLPKMYNEQVYTKSCATIKLVLNNGNHYIDQCQAVKIPKMFIKDIKKTTSMNNGWRPFHRDIYKPMFSSSYVDYKIINTEH